MQHTVLQRSSIASKSRPAMTELWKSGTPPLAHASTPSKNPRASVTRWISCSRRSSASNLIVIVDHLDQTLKLKFKWMISTKPWMLCRWPSIPAEPVWGLLPLGGQSESTTSGKLRFKKDLLVLITWYWLQGHEASAVVLSSRGRSYKFIFPPLWQLPCKWGWR